TLPGPLRGPPALPTPRSPTRALTLHRSVRQNDHAASGEGSLRPARMRARPEGQSGLPDRRTGETWFAHGPSGRAASPDVKVPTRASVRVTSGAYRSDLHLCRSTRTVRDEDKAL